MLTEKGRVQSLRRRVSLYTEYPDPHREEWETRILPVLKKIPIAAKRTKKSVSFVSTLSRSSQG